MSSNVHIMGRYSLNWGPGGLGRKNVWKPQKVLFSNNIYPLVTHQQRISCPSCSSSTTKEISLTTSRSAPDVSLCSSTSSPPRLHRKSGTGFPPPELQVTVTLVPAAKGCWLSPDTDIVTHSGEAEKKRTMKLCRYLFFDEKQDIFFEEEGGCIHQRG